MTTVKITATTTNIRVTAHPNGDPVIVQTQVAGYQGPQGATGPTGATGATGSTGATGTAATIAVHSTTTGDAGSSAIVTNVGSSSAASLDFIIPRGDTGATGSTGPTGPAGAVTGQTLYFDNTASDLTLPSVTGTVYSFNGGGNPDIIHRSSGSFLTDGFLAGMKITVSGAGQAGNNGTFVVTIAAASDLTLATIHALTTESAGATVTIKADRERITRAPASGTEQDESQSIVLADGDVTLDTYVTPAGYPGALAIPAGTWNFHAWFYVSAGNTCTVKFRVLKISATGVETTLFTTAASAAIAATTLASPTEVQLSYTVASDIPLLTTDRVAVRIVGNNSSATARVVHFVYQGSSHASHVETTLPVAGVGVPVGGATGVVLAKKSGSDYDTEWVATPSGLIVPQSKVTGLTSALAAKVASAAGVVVVDHGTDGTTARPSAAVVYWKGTVEPVNAVDADLWWYPV